MANAFIIEINGKAAGLAVEERRGFRFYASHRIFWKLDGRIYRRVREAERAADEVWRHHLAGKSAHVIEAAPTREDKGRTASLPPPA